MKLTGDLFKENFLQEIKVFGRKVCTLIIGTEKKYIAEVLQHTLKSTS